MPDADGRKADWPRFAALAQQLPDFERDQAAYLAGPPVDWLDLDQHPEVDRQEFEFIGGAWSERRRRS
jgi:hypothetical protein